MTKIINTQLKLKDASTQMKIAIKNSTDEDVFRSCINAFISHARSVTFIMQKESSKNDELNKWYKNEQNRLEQLPLLEFFNKKRVYSIHRGVVSPTKDQVSVYDSKSSYLKFPGGKTLEQWNCTAKIKHIRFVEGDIVTRVGNNIIAWFFDDIQDYIPGDSGNVLRLCEQYFGILKDLVYSWNLKRRELNLG
jgi:hypothetical protein